MIVAFAQTTGMIQGGWGYVIASFTVTWLFFIGYAASLYGRSKEEA
jgi:hypothetical protein